MSDLHYGEKAENDVKSSKQQDMFIKQAQADVLVLTGDMVSNYGWNGTKPFYEPLWY